MRAAREEFAEKGVEGASIRSVARRAGVDPKTVRHWFASRAELVAATIVPGDRNPAEEARAVMADGVVGVGERLVRTVLTVWDSPGGRDRFRILVSGLLTGDASTDAFRTVVGEQVLGRLVELAPDADPRRLVLAAAPVTGLLAMRYVFELDAATQMSIDELARTVGPVIDQALLGQLPVEVRQLDEPPVDG